MPENTNNVNNENTLIRIHSLSLIQSWMFYNHIVANKRWLEFFPIEDIRDVMLKLVWEQHFRLIN